MSGIGFSEFLILLMIGLIVLGPKRLPRVASQLGSWIGQARRMTRVMKRQLEEELDLDRELNVRPGIAPPAYVPPRDDDSYSPLHEEPAAAAPGVAGTDANGTPAVDDGESASSEADGEQRRDA